MRLWCACFAFVFYWLEMPLVIGQVDHQWRLNQLSSSFEQAKDSEKLPILKQLLPEAACIHPDFIFKYAYQGLELPAVRQNDQARSMLYSYLSEAYTLSGLYDQADSLACLALEVTVPGTKEQALAHRAYGRFLIRKPDAPVGLLHIERSMALFDSLGLPQEALRSRLLVQPVLRENDAVAAADNLMEGLETARRLKEIELESQFLLHIAYLHTRMENIVEARRITDELGNFFEQINHRYDALQLRFLNAWLDGKEDKPVATPRMQQVARDCRAMKDHFHEALAHTYLSLSDFVHPTTRKRVAEVERALFISDSLNIEIPRAPLFLSWHILGQYPDSCISVARETFYMAPLWGRRLHAFQAAENLTEFYHYTGQIDSARKFFNVYRNARFEWHPTEKTMVSGRLEAKMAADKLLEEQQKVAEQKSALKDAQLREQETTRNVLIGCSFGLSVILLLAWRAYRQQRKSRVIIEEQKIGLERMDRLNREVFSVIAHDFKGPLVTMKILAENLQNTDLSKTDLEQTGADLHQQAQQTQMLLENLLNWARAELKLSLPDRPNCKPHQICEEIKQSLSTVAKGKEIKLVNRIPEEVQSPLHADILRIILRNLISNGLKFSHSYQMIEIGYDQKNESIYVSDQGVGIETDLINELFSKTVASRLGTGFESGFGLGLYICHELLRKSKWAITVDSSIGSGTQFTFYPNTANSL